MNYKPTTPAFKRFATSSTVVAVAVLMTFSSSIAVYADKFDDQINAIQGQINGYQAQAADLSKQADTLQTAVANLQAQQDTIQAQINLSQAKYDQLIAQIKETEDKIAKNQDVLGETISNLYVDNTVSPVEMLASSKSIGDYLDQQEYRSSVRDQVEGAIKEIKALKKSLEQKKVETEQVLTDQKAQKSTLAAKQAEQANLLAQTQSNEAAYQSLIGAKNGQISELYNQQRASLSRAGGQILVGDPGKGGYPAKYANATKDTITDSWGMLNRECVSYTAFKVEQTYGDLNRAPYKMPYWGGVGNANEWPGNASNAGIPTGSSPKVGSVAIKRSVYPGDIYGHAAWVKSVSGNTVIVSQYNWGSPGSYSEMEVSASFFDTYIYFGG